ncbi:hypothetical protein NMG60_11012356 [Bertholletia excelsa]
MKILNSKLSLVPLIILILLVHTCNCRQIQRLRNEEADQRLRAKYYSTFAQYSSHIPRQPEAGKDPVYEVSHRLVPGGPNPLHN